MERAMAKQNLIMMITHTQTCDTTVDNKLKRRKKSVNNNKNLTHVKYLKKKTRAYRTREKEKEIHRNAVSA